MDTKSVELFPASSEARASTSAAPEVAQPVVDVTGVVASAVEGDKPASAIPEEEIERMTADIIAALKTVYDPEIPSDVYELGLIYRIDIEDDKTVVVDMTLTSPGCPVAGEMPGWVQNAVNSVGGVRETKVNLVFDPPWHQGRMSDEARLALNMF
jgi:FeS assembly SUF system protein